MDILGILAELHGKRDRINQAIAALEALGGATATLRTGKTATKVNGAHVGNGAKTASLIPPAAKKRVISPEGRQRMAEAQRKRHAKAKRAMKSAAKKASAGAPATVKSATGAAKKVAPKTASGGLTAAGRKRLSEATKARWAAKKAAAKTA